MASETSQKDTYLVIGGCGLLGRHIAEHLRDRGDTVTVMDIVRRYDDIPFHLGDISDEKAANDIFEKLKPSCVFHTASPHATIDDDALFKRVVEVGTKNVIAACVANGVRKLVWTGSSGVVFDGKHLNGVDETAPYVKDSILGYIKSKIVAEKAVLAANGKGGLYTTSLRPLQQIFYCRPGDRQMIAGVYKVYKEGKTGFQIGDGKNRTDWTYVTNVADAHVLAADKLLPTSNPPVAGEIFFITNDEPWLFWGFINAIWDRLDVHYPGQRVKKRPLVLPEGLALVFGGIAEAIAFITRTKANFTRWTCLLSSRHRWHNVDKAKKALGYIPKVSVEEGLDRLIEWWVKDLEVEEKR